ncbi:MAG TPA: class I SAM-dependent methyltransferase [Anaerolineales bacterium]|nr:class I SAM-dependent methyltransferase [Anaerolineales bacterium]
MDRNTWLKEMRRDTEEDYDRIWAPQYDEKWGLYSNTSHQQFLQTFLVLVQQPGTILDAACGAGRYMPMLLEKGHSVTGIDQAQGMLARAKEKFPAVHLEKLGLQEISYREMFDGAICMDALENVSPEDWPLVLHNFHRALKPSGYFYFTVEIAPEEEVEQAFLEAQKLGLPVVRGEWINDGVYHYYPSMSQVRAWLQQAGLQIVEEGEGDGYHHFITRKA